MLRKIAFWLKGEIKTPPFSVKARAEAGRLIGSLQEGERLSMPHSCPMPSIGKRCHELRVIDEQVSWRIIYRVDVDAIVIADVFAKKTEKTPRQIISECKRRFKEFDNI